MGREEGETKHRIDLVPKGDKTEINIFCKLDKKIVVKTFNLSTLMR